MLSPKTEFSLKIFLKNEFKCRNGFLYLNVQLYSAANVNRKFIYLSAYNRGHKYDMSRYYLCQDLFEQVGKKCYQECCIWVWQLNIIQIVRRFLIYSGVRLPDGHLAGPKISPNSACGNKETIIIGTRAPLYLKVYLELLF